MQKLPSASATLRFVPLAVLIVGCSFTSATQKGTDTANPRNHRKETIDEVWQIFNRSYIDPTFNQQDWMEVRTEYLDRIYQSDQALYDAVDEMIGLLDDPDARFIPPDEFDDLVAEPASAANALTKTDLTLDQGQPVEHRTAAVDGSDVGYIRVTHFGGYTADELETAIASLETQGIENYVLDLRSNPGGLLNSAVDSAQLWLESGLIASIHSRDTVRDAESDGESLMTDKPLAVLVNGNTGNASELLAGALQGQQRGILVGAPTYGDNIVRAIRPLSHGAGVIMPTAKWYPPSGQDISGSGLEPDVVVQLSEADWQQLNETQRLGTAADPQFVEAVQALENRQPSSGQID